MNDANAYLRRHLSAFLDLMREASVYELELEQGQARVKLSRIPDDAPGNDEALAVELEAMEEAPPSVIEITSPLVGMFYRAAKPNSPPLVAEGSRVEPGTVVGIVEALQVLTEVVAGCEGVVTRVYDVDGHPVEYGEKLFEVSVDG